ncbi:MAG: hypothetical protein RIA08_04880 [Roseovarius sp.]|uniref:hypothetical protein n=1 Tax=Roseovarius sp. TaxID=1486281 RepID=UPI0032EB7261
MTETERHLVALSRVELTAVHQQFLHMLVLRALGDEAHLPRVTAIDEVDFANAMDITALLVERGVPVRLPAHWVRPGRDVPSVLRAEREMEEAMAAVLGAARAEDDAARACIARAAAPRADYRGWLEARLAEAGAPGPDVETVPEVAGVLALLTALVEQALLHAFLARAQADRAGADNAWRLSGAAMLYATAIVRAGLADGQGVVPGEVPGVGMAATPEAAFEADMALTRRCAEAARRAAERQEREMGRLCGRIAEACDRIAGMGRNGAFPDGFGRAPMFDDFEATCARFLS